MSTVLSLQPFFTHWKIFKLFEYSFVSIRTWFEAYSLFKIWVRIFVRILGSPKPEKGKFFSGAKCERDWSEDRHARQGPSLVFQWVTKEKKPQYNHEGTITHQ